MTSVQLTVLLFALLHTLFEVFLYFLNLKNLHRMRDDQPDYTESLMDKDKWQKATDYSAAKLKLSIIQEFAGFLIFIVTILFLIPYVFGNWDATANNGILESSFICVILLLSIQLPGLVFDWFSQFKIESRFGFNKSNNKLWVSDKLKENGLGLIFGTLIFALIVWLYRTLSDFSSFWWAIAFAIFFLIQLSLMILWPKFILPLFNKLSPLEDGELRTRLLDLADRSGFAAQTIEIIDGSKRSSHSNAYFTGFGKFRRIVLYDTLLEQMEHNEVEAVLAHEIGHYKMGHIPKRLILSFILGLAGFWGLHYALSWSGLYTGLGLNHEYVGSISVLLVAMILIVPNFTYWLSPVSNFFSRKHEYEADHFAAKSMKEGGSLVNALTKLYRENLSHPLPHPLLVFFHYSHPTYYDRVDTLVKLEG